MNLHLTDATRVAAACRIDTWNRLAPKLLAMHIDVGAGPIGLVRLLEQSNNRVRCDAQRVLRALERQPWRVQALEGPYRTAAKLGFKVLAGNKSWWLQFEPAPRLRIVRIEDMSRAPALQAE